MAIQNLDYYTSERFIHDGIVKRARAGIPTLYESWKKKQRLRPFVLSWPAEEIIWNSEPTEQAVAFDAPLAKDLTQEFLRRVQKKTAAYALLFWEQREQAVVGILESRHGSVSWYIPIMDHGNVRVLGPLEEKTDVDSLGLNWDLALGREAG